MIPDQGENPVPGGVIQAKGIGSPCRDFRGSMLVSAVMAFSVFVCGADKGFSGIMEQHGKAEIRLRRHVLHRTDRMLPQVI